MREETAAAPTLMIGDGINDAAALAATTVGIAMQSIIAGLALSGAAMLVAAFGDLTPIAGALLQEAIDVAVILNALRALGCGKKA